MTEAVKDPRKVAAGKAGMAARWGPQRVVRLDALTVEERNVVLALVAARESSSKKAAAETQTPAAAMSTEGTADAASTQ